MMQHIRYQGSMPWLLRFPYISLYKTYKLKDEAILVKGHNLNKLDRVTYQHFYRVRWREDMLIYGCELFKF